MTIYKKQITKITDSKLSFKTDTMKVPTLMHLSEDLLPNDRTFEKFIDVCSDNAIYKNLIAMSDVQSKPGRKNASGTVVASEKYILPQVNDSDPCCGMRLVRSNLNEDNITLKEIDTLFKELVKVVPTKTYFGTVLPFSKVVDVCRNGTSALIKYLNIKTKNEIENSMSRGNFFDRAMSVKDIFDVIPKLYLFFAQFRLGITGAAGNHFFDLMKVTKEIDPELCRQFNLKKGQYLFMIHAGSGILGQYTMYTYTPKKCEHLSQSIMVRLGKMLFKTSRKKTFSEIQKRIKNHKGKQELFRFDGDAPDGKMYMDARAAASNFGVANRATITHNVSEAIKSVLGRDPEFDLLYDMAHVNVSREFHFDRNLWIHRSNTSRAYGPGMLDHPVFNKTGEPAFIPSSMSTPAYIGVGTKDNQSTFYSSAHGTGKAPKSTEDDVPTTREELMKKMAKKGVRLYNARSSKTLEQDSSQYKNIDKAIKATEANNILKIIAKMEPVAVIMY